MPSIHPFSSAYLGSGHGIRSLNKEADTSIFQTTSSISSWGIPFTGQPRDTVPPACSQRWYPVYHLWRTQGWRHWTALRSIFFLLSHSSNVQRAPTGTSKLTPILHLSPFSNRLVETDFQINRASSSKSTRQSTVCAVMTGNNKVWGTTTNTWCCFNMVWNKVQRSDTFWLMTV